ncbi:MAG TPA: CocE/NonD family hydrolase [Caulobacteraceae bacterium]|nr:CocE/NonD family hydrolase [Caulobacteraceae bacterium]
MANTTRAHEIIEQRDLHVRMRDGVRLATSAFLPGRAGEVAAGRFPTVVARTPYGKDFGVVATLHRRFVPAGYAFVVQDVRGRYGSEGRWRPLRDDGDDGVDLLAWIAAQPWSDGKIGTIGTSYVGGTQHALALKGSPHLAAMVPVDAMSNPGRFGIRHAGAFEMRWLNWVLTLGNPNLHALTMTGERTDEVRSADGASTGAWTLPLGGAARPDENGELRDRLAAREAAVARVGGDAAARAELKAMGDRSREFARALPLRAGGTPLRHAPDYEAWLLEAMSHGDNDAWWAGMGVDVADQAETYQDVPVLHVTGAYDSWGGPVANLNFARLTQAKSSPQRLLFGPWTHGAQAMSYAGIAEFGPAAAIDLRAEELRWFDRWLKGVANGAEAAAPVRVFVMGGGDAHRTPEGRVFVGGRWRDEREWPLARAVETAFYLHADGRLSTTPPTDSSPSRYRFDPRDPVPSIGGPVSSQGDLMQAGAQDQRQRPDLWPCTVDAPLADRPDVLVFQTEPLAEALEVVGPVVVKLWASSDGPDTDFTAKLVDVYPPNADFPDGLALNIGDGIVRARYRQSLNQAQMLEPGQPYEFTIELYPTALVFQKGHRIRVDISSSSFPRFDVNPNTGEPLNDNRRTQIAHNTIYLDSDHPSRIILPIIPAGSSQ